MTARRPAFTLALATAIAGTAPLPAVADEPTEPTQTCFTEALTNEEVEDGAVSVIECVDGEELPLARGNVTLAILYDVSDSYGDLIYVTGPTCTGRSLNMSASDPWNNRISATDLVACGNAKHYTGGNWTGTYELKSGVGYHTFSGVMNNSISSIEYAP